MSGGGARDDSFDSTVRCTGLGMLECHDSRKSTEEHMIQICQICD